MNQIETKTRLIDLKPVIEYHMDQLSLHQLFEKYIPQTDKMILAPADTLTLMVFNIINAPRPLYKIFEWATDYLDGIGETPHKAQYYNDDRISRDIDRLYNCDRNGLKIELTANAIKAHKLMTDNLHNDSTTITLKGRYANQNPDAVQLLHGHNKDFRPDCLQIVYGITTTSDGCVPLNFQLFDGNQSDDKTHIPNWDQLRQLLGKTDFVYTADCKLCSEENLDHIHQNGGRFITIVPKNRNILQPFRQLLQDGDVKWQMAYSTQDNRKPSSNNDFFTFESHPTEKGYRLIWVLSSTKLRLDQKTRERQLSEAEAELADLGGRLNRYSLKTIDQIKAAVKKATAKTKDMIDVQILENKTVGQKKVSAGRPGRNSKYKKQTRIVYQLQCKRNQAAIDHQALTDGTFPLITNTDGSCAETLRTYKQQPALEKRFNTTKSILNIAPVFLKKSTRIEAVTFLYFVALMIISLMERSIHQQMLEESIDRLPILPQRMKTAKPTWNNLRYFFRSVHLSMVYIKGRLVSQAIKGLSGLHSLIVRMLGVPSSIYGMIFDP